MVEPRQKPAGRPVHTVEGVRIPRQAARAVWLRGRAETRRLTADEGQDGRYQEAAAREERAVDGVTDAAGRGGTKLARRAAQKRRAQAAQAAQSTQAAKAADTGCGPDRKASAGDRVPWAGDIAEKRGPYGYYKEDGLTGWTERSEARALSRQAPSTQARLRATQAGRTADRRGRISRRAGVSVDAPIGTTVQGGRRGDARKPPRPAPAPKTAMAGRTAAGNAAASNAGRGIRQAKRRVAQAAQASARTAAAVAETARKALWAAGQSLAVALAAGGAAAICIIVVIGMVALVAGSGFGIFFAGESTSGGMAIQDAITRLNGEYQEKLEKIEADNPHDRLELTSNDGSYAIAWRDVLAVFAARTSGAADGAPVAYLDEANLNRLRKILWEMNEITWRVEMQTHEAADAPVADAAAAGTSGENPDELSRAAPGDGGEGASAASGTTAPDPARADENEDAPGTATVTESVLLITLHHKTAEEMRTEYRFNARQSEYLTLLSSEDVAPLWAELLGGFATGELGGEILAPGAPGDWSGGALQWPLPVAGTITSPFGGRTDPITGASSYHGGTDIATPEGTPILAAAAGTVTAANALDSWGGSYGYYVKLDHGGGLETLYAHCSAICVTVGQQVQPGEVIAYVGHTGRATGSHLHWEATQNGVRVDAMGVG